MNEESRKQERMEAIVSQALPLVRIDARPEEINDDWVVNFFEKCRYVSNQEMQQSWASLLAGEANQPGSFSRRTVNLLADLEPRHAKLLQLLRVFSWDVKHERYPIFDRITNFTRSFFTEAQITEEDLAELDELGIAKMAEGFFGFCDCPTITLRYFTQVVKLEKKPNYFMSLGNFVLTKCGKELSALCYEEPNMKYFHHILDHWRQEPDVSSIQVIS